MPADPFLVKQYAKWHPVRILFTLRARLLEWDARRNFLKNAIPIKETQFPSEILDIDWSNTAVTLRQAQYLLHFLRKTEHFESTVVVEIGSYRGVTTNLLAKSTARQVVSVDPFIGYGGSVEDYKLFRRAIGDYNNVQHLKATSGEASRTWSHLPISFVFIDAVHDYVNTSFDIHSWGELLVNGGIMALHDTDELRFAGTRKAVADVSELSLLAHIHNLTILYKP